MPIIQIDVQPLSAEQREELRTRAAAVVHKAIGSPYDYISIVIREWPSEALVEAGGVGPYHDRVTLEPVGLPQENRR